MANFKDKEIMLVGLKGDSVFIRYSASADGTDFTEEYTEGQDYVGLATGQSAPIDKSGYTWRWLGGETVQIENILDIIIEEQQSIIDEQDSILTIQNALIGGNE